MLSHADRLVVEQDRALPGLATALDDEAALALLRTAMPDASFGAAQIHYVRYKPGASCLTGLRVTDDGGTRHFTLKALAVDAADKWQKAATVGGAWLDEERRIVVRAFPDDRRLPGARWLLAAETQGHARRALALEGCTFEVIAYKPERRLVTCAMRDGEPVAVVKCYERTGYARAAAGQGALAAAPLSGVTTASVLHDRMSTIVTPWVRGRMLDVARDPFVAFVGVGEALARLHDTPIAHLARRGAADDAISLRRLTRDVARWLPAMGERLAAMASRVAQQMADQHEVAPVHGDFYAKQVLVRDALRASGTLVAFLDFDELGLGDPHADLALFIAHVERDVIRGAVDRARGDEVIDAVLAGYLRHRDVSPRRLRWRTAEALLRLTPHPFRHRASDWPELTGALIARAEALLDSTTGVTRRSASDRVASSLATDASLAFVEPLLDAATATAVLRAERGAGRLACDEITVNRVAMTRHKPGRRCLLAFDVRQADHMERWLGKVRAKGGDARGARIHRLLWDAGLRDIAEPIGFVPSWSMTLQRAVPGSPLAAAVQGGSDPHELGGLVAGALHRLHAVRARVERRWMLDDELTLLRERFEALRQREPAHRAAVARVERRLMGIADPLRARAWSLPIHRDFYHDQVLVDGSRVTIVDLDLVTMGDPAIDVGNFVAHLVEAGWRGAIDSTSATSLAWSFVAASTVLAPRAINEDVAARHALLAVGRLMEIASRMDERRVHFDSLLATLDGRLSRARRHLDLSLLSDLPRWHVA